MGKNGLSKADEIRFWIETNSDRIMIFIIMIFIFLYGYISQSYRQTDFYEYTSKVELVNFDYEKSYALPDFYSTNQKLDKIIFDLTYFHNGVKYESKSVVYNKYLTPQFERIIENKEMDRLVVKCKKEAPDEVMIFVKK